MKIAIIIGAGPAGLTAAYELCRRTDIKPVILEKSNIIGGISATINYRGNKMDVGGHRFFSKSDRVTDWWTSIFPIEGEPDNDPEKKDDILLRRPRKSKIYFGSKFFDYPVSLNMETIKNLGARKMIRTGFSYARSVIFPLKESNLEQLFINRFGRELYETFFKSYTEKLWGIHPKDIDSSWGKQRIKGLSVTKAILHFFKRKEKDLKQKNTETSLIGEFLYPKYGPGHFWEHLTSKIKEMGGEVIMEADVKKIKTEGHRVKGVSYEKDGNIHDICGDYVFSSMPVKELISGIEEAPKEAREVADGLMYRDFISIGLLVKKINIPRDNTWIYIHDREARMIRLQFFNNWSPFLSDNRDYEWLGLEYVCSEQDDIWKKSNDQLVLMGKEELERIGIIDDADLVDGFSFKLKNVYPAYFGTYNRFGEIKDYVSKFENLFLIGRNGMHKYNNQDHSILTAMVAVDNIASGIKEKNNIWDINTEEEYHEHKK